MKQTHNKMDRYLTAIEMRITTCSCGLTWAAPEKWFKKREEDHKTFHCPNGCPCHFPQESEKERLEQRLKEEHSCCISAHEKANYLERQCRAYKGHITRLKQKVQSSKP